MARLLVQVRGASGSGKSTLVRRFLEELQPAPARYTDKARWGLAHVESASSRPFALGYARQGREPLIVPGHYDAPGGGCDMIKKADHAFDIAACGLRYGDVLMEGLFLSKDYRRLAEFAARLERPPVVLYLDLPQPECEEFVQQRREALGKARRPLVKHEADWREVAAATRKLEAAGLTVERHDRAGAAARLRELLL